ncbi:hypothetical protein HDU96_008319 [Phlyctochytrium bullatum]|nr:hypothetical protein HDU96_008319 [Phlyctochytrium bullatum]
MAPDASVDALKVELSNLHEHNCNLLRELNELRKEKLAWLETEKMSAKLDAQVVKLNQDVAASQSENARLRKQNEDLSRKLESEMSEFAEARSRWAEQEQALLSAARSDRLKLRELRDLHNIKEHKDFKADAEELQKPVESNRDSSPRAEAVALLEENLQLKEKVEGLEMQLTKSNHKINKQEQDILELQRTVEALMDEIESGQFNAQFLSSVLGDAEASGGLHSEIHLTPPSPPASHGTLSGGHSREVSFANHHDADSDDEAWGRGLSAPGTPMLSGAKSMSSLADEYKRLNEPAPDPASVQPSLRAKCAALGLSTEGNRAILKKRLMRHYAKKKKQAEKAPVA